jgi:hypothetical protein
VPATTHPPTYLNAAAGERFWWYRSCSCTKKVDTVLQDPLKPDVRGMYTERVRWGAW